LSVGAAVGELDVIISVFFPQQLPLNTAGMYLQIKFLFHQLRQLSETQFRLCGSSFGHEPHDSGSQLMAAFWAPLVGQQSRQAALFEGELRLVKRGPGEAELPSRLRNGLAVDSHVSEHFIFHLDQVVGIEEVTVLEERMGDILGMGIERPQLPQQQLLAWIAFRPRHLPPPRQPKMCKANYGDSRRLCQIISRR